MTSMLLLLSLPPFTPFSQAGGCEAERCAWELSVGDVIISEFMANPAAVSDGDGEWLEIANLTSQSVDLQGLLLSDDGSNSHSIDEPVVIPAGGFAVLGANGDSSQNGGLSVDHVYDGTLGNSDDEIILSYGGVEIDAVRYSSSWVDSGASTALRDDAWGATSNDDAGSWCSSSSAYGSGDLGTPGTSNDCGSDEEPDPGDTGSGGSSGDCDGAQDWGVVINEFLANPAGSDDGYEWVELYHDGSVELSLAGWTLGWRKSSSTSTVDLEGVSLQPGAHLLLGDDEVSPAPDMIISLDLGSGSSGDGVYLMDDQGCVVDAVVYGGSNSDEIPDESGEPAESVADKPGDDESLARISDGWDSNRSGEDFVISDAPTPGSANPVVTAPVCDTSGRTGLRLNELLPNPDGSDSGYEWLEIVNVGSDARLDGWMIEVATQGGSWSEDFVFPDGVGLDGGSFVVVGGEEVDFVDFVAEDLSMGSGSGGDGVRLVDCEGEVVDVVVYGEDNADDIEDESGEASSSLAGKPGDDVVLARYVDGGDSDRSGDDFWLTEDWTPGASNPEPPRCDPAGSEGVKLNELVSNPEGSDDGYEWVELVNTGESTVILDGWQLEVGKSSWSGDIDFTFPAQVNLEPGAYLVVGGDYVGEADFQSGSLSLGNGSSGDGVRLLDCEGAVVDTVIYGDDNADALSDDLGETVEVPAPEPEEAWSIGRSPDGSDSDEMAEDWASFSEPTPGAANKESEIGGGSSSSGCGSDKPSSPGSGCSTGGIAPAWLAFSLLIYSRRRTH